MGSHDHDEGRDMGVLPWSGSYLGDGVARPVGVREDMRKSSGVDAKKGATG